MKYKNYCAEVWSAAGLLAALGLEAVATGMRPWVTPDTSGYLSLPPWPACLGVPRIPVYGWAVHLILRATGGFGIIPWLQFGFFALAVLGFVHALRWAGLPAPARAAFGLSCAFSNLLLIWCRALMPALPSVAFLLLAIAAVLAMTGGARRPALLAGGFFGLACLLNPGFLPFVVFLPSLLLGLGGWRAWRGAVFLGLMCLLPLLAFASLRAVEVKNFNIVSFGGFQMSGMAALMISPAMLDRLPADDMPLGAKILAARTAQEAAGITMPVPANSTGQRSFNSEAVGYFDILARTHDSVLYQAVAEQRGAGESWVAFNDRLQRFDWAVIRAVPGQYLSWVLGCLARLAGHALVLNPIFLFTSAAAFGLFLCRPGAGPAPLRAMAVIIFCYGAGTALLTVLITFPAQRYIDISALLLAAWPLYAVLARLPVRWDG